MLREAWNCLSDKGAELLPLAWQMTPVQGRISVQAMAQQPIVTCNQNAAVLCPNNSFLCGLGSEYSGNCIDQTGAPYPRPIRQVYAGTHFFCCERLSASMARSLRLELYLYTAVDSRPGPGGSRTTASCQS